jgi:DNA-3-methyladenine glycosylase
MILRQSFYARPTLEVARELLGKVLAHRTRSGTAAGRIVEVEAYIGEDDPACHAAPGRTARNAPLYGPPGVAYVYLNYGLHYLVNAVTEADGWPAAVLIRALEPVEGLELMRRRRARAKWRRGKPVPADHDLCRGPGNLTAALGITLEQNLLPLTRPPLTIEDRGDRVEQVAWSQRIGIRVGTEHLWRCTVPGSPAVSGPKQILGSEEGRTNSNA